MPNNEENKSDLKKMIEQIYREENMDEVVIILNKVKKARHRYENSKWLYQIILPGLPLLIWQIERLLKSNTVTSQLVKTLNLNKVALLVYTLLYGVGMLFEIAILISLLFKVLNLQWWLVTGSIFMVILAIKFILGKKIIRDTYRSITTFCEAIESQSEFDSNL